MKDNNGHAFSLLEESFEQMFFAGKRILTPAEKILGAIFKEALPYFYAYIIVDDECGMKRKLTLEEAVRETLDKGLADKPNLRQAVELYYCSNRRLTFREIAQMSGGVTRQNIHSRVKRALMLLKQSSQCNLLRRFIIPLPERLKELHERTASMEETMYCLLESYVKTIEFLRDFLQALGLEEELTGLLKSATASGAVPEKAISRKTLNDLMLEYSNSQAWRVIRELGTANRLN